VIVYNFVIVSIHINALLLDIGILYSLTESDIQVQILSTSYSTISKLPAFFFLIRLPSQFDNEDIKYLSDYTNMEK
jgi:hypothetical protein